MKKLKRLRDCRLCSRPGRAIVHVGECPGVDSGLLQRRLISPFRRSAREERDKKYYSKSTIGVDRRIEKNPWGRDPNPGPYGG